MKETKWIGKSGGKVSDPDNWDNGVPDFRTSQIFPEYPGRVEIEWDIKSISIDTEKDIPDCYLFYISGDCMVGGSYFVPDAIREHFESFKDESINLEELDRPPPGYGMFCANKNWQGGGATHDASDEGNWNGPAPGPGDDVNFGSWSDDYCDWDITDTMNTFTVDSNYDGTITLTDDCIVSTTFTLNGSSNAIFDCDAFNLTIPNLDLATQELLGGSGTIECSGNWDNSGTFTKETSTVDFNGSSGQTVDPGGDFFYTITINNTSGSDVDFSGVTIIENDLTVTNGSMDMVSYTLGVTNDVSISSGATLKGGTAGVAMGSLTINGTYSASSTATSIYKETGGGFAYDNDGTMTHNNGLFKFLYTGTTNIDATGNFYDLELDGSGLLLTLTTTLNVVHDLTLTTGQLSTANYNVDVGADILISFGTFTAGSSTINCAGDWTNNSGTFTAGSCTINCAGDWTNNSGTITAGSCTINCAGDWSNSGTFTKGTSTVTFDGSSAVDQTITSGGDAFYGLTFNNTHGSAKIIIADALDVDGTFALTDGQIDMDTNNPAINTSGNVTFSSGSITAGSGTWTFDGTTTYTDNIDLIPQDLGDILVHDAGGTATLTLASRIQVRDLTIEEDHTLDAGGAYTIYVQGDWLNISGGFTKSASTVEFNGTSTQSIYSGNPNVPFNNLKISNVSSSDIDVLRWLVINGTFDCSNSNCTLVLDNSPNPPGEAKVQGDVTFGEDFSVNHGGNPWIFEGTLNYTDDNTTAQNLGPVILDPAIGSITVTLATHIRFNDITIEPDSTFDSGDQNIYCEGDWTNDGTFDCGTSSYVHFEGASDITGMNGPDNTFHDVSIDDSITVTTPTRVIVTGNLLPGLTACFTADYGSSTDRLNIEGDCTINGTFRVSDRQVIDRCN